MQRNSVSGTRSSLLWLLILLVVVLLIGVIVAVLVILPQMQASRAEQARLTEVERHYQAGVAFQNVDDWGSAETEYKQVILMNAGYKDVQARIAEVKGRASAIQSTATAAAIAQAAQAQANAQSTAVFAPTATAAALEGHYQKGAGYINLGRWQDAEAELEQVFGANPNYKDVQQLLAHVQAEIVKLTPTDAPLPPTPKAISTLMAISTPQMVALQIVSAVGDPASKTPDGPFDLQATGGYYPVDAWARIPGATHIWYRDYTSGPLYFAKVIEIPAEATDVKGSIQITADNFFSLKLNGVNYGGTTPPDAAQYTKIYTFDLMNLRPGNNYLLVEANDVGGSAMLIYRCTLSYQIP
jgi:hypothetical protein